MTALNTGELPAKSELRVPDIKVSVRQLFGIDTDIEVPAFSEPRARARPRRGLPFDRETTLAIWPASPTTAA